LVSHGASVTIFVSPGGSQIPDVVNEQIQLAQGQLANAGFTNIQINEVSSPGLQDGIVTMQDPPAGQTVPTSTLITLNVVKNQPTQPPTTAPPTTTPPTSSSPSP
jgi:beta-lactam-binding protein with PASTA domain